MHQAAMYTADVVGLQQAGHVTFEKGEQQQAWN